MPSTNITVTLTPEEIRTALTDFAKKSVGDGQGLGGQTVVIYAARVDGDDQPIKGGTPQPIPALAEAQVRFQYTKPKNHKRD